MRLREMSNDQLLDLYKKECSRRDPNEAEIHFRKGVKEEIKIRLDGRGADPRPQDKE